VQDEAGLGVAVIILLRVAVVKRMRRKAQADAHFKCNNLYRELRQKLRLGFDSRVACEAVRLVGFGMFSLLDHRLALEVLGFAQQYQPALALGAGYQTAVLTPTDDRIAFPIATATTIGYHLRATID